MCVIGFQLNNTWRHESTGINTFERLCGWVVICTTSKIVNVNISPMRPWGGGKSQTQKEGVSSRRRTASRSPYITVTSWVAHWGQTDLSLWGFTVNFYLCQKWAEASGIHSQLEECRHSRVQTKALHHCDGLVCTTKVLRQQKSVKVFQEVENLMLSGKAHDRGCSQISMWTPETRVQYNYKFMCCVIKVLHPASMKVNWFRVLRLVWLRANIRCWGTHWGCQCPRKH